MPKVNLGAKATVEWKQTEKGPAPVFSFEGDWNGGMARICGAHFHREYRIHQHTLARERERAAEAMESETEVRERTRDDDVLSTQVREGEDGRPDH